MRAEAVNFRVDGTTLRGDFHPSEVGGDRAIVLNHGLLSSRREFMDTPERLAELGYHVLAFDQRGFGESEGERGIHTRANAVADLRAALDFLRSRGLGARAAVIGHSLGAAFATLALAEGVPFKAAVLAAPMRTIRGEIGAIEMKQYQVGHAIHRLKTRLGLGHFLVPYRNRYADLFVDEAAKRRAEEVAFLQERVSLENYDELFAVDAEAWARRVRQPALVVVAKHDKAVKAESSHAVHAALAGEKAIVTIDSGHSAWGDRDAKALLAHVDNWLSRYL